MEKVLDMNTPAGAESYPICRDRQAIWVYLPPCTLSHLNVFFTSKGDVETQPLALGALIDHPPPAAGDRGRRPFMHATIEIFWLKSRGFQQKLVHKESEFMANNFSRSLELESHYERLLCTTSCRCGQVKEGMEVGYFYYQGT